MTLVIRPCPPGLAGVDLVGTVSASIAKNFRAAGKGFVMRYGRSVTAEEVAAITEEGMGLGFYSYGRQSEFSTQTGEQDAQAVLDHLRSVGVPIGAMLTLTVDLETPKDTIPDVLAYERDGWAPTVTATGCTSGAYVGAGLGMTSAQLFGMKATRYIKSGSRIVDLAGAAAEPECGYAMTQILPFDQACGGANVDYCFSQYDYFGRSLFMVWQVTTAVYSFPLPDTAHDTIPPGSPEAAQ
jgi:hypothetical protein